MADEVLRDGLTYDRELQWWTGWVALPRFGELRIESDEHDEADDADPEAVGAMPDPGDNGGEVVADAAANADELAGEADDVLAEFDQLTKSLGEPGALEKLVREAAPLIDLDQTLPDGHSMRDVLRHATDAMEADMDEGLVGADDDPAGPDDAEREARALRGEFALTIADRGGSGPTPEQAAAVAYLTAHEPHVRRVALDAVARLARLARTAYDAYHDAAAGGAERYPRDATAEDMLTRLRLSDVHVERPTKRRPARDGVAYVSLDFACAWDREHGVAVVLHRDRVVHVGTAGDGWDDPAA